ncbi:MAG: ATP-dependent zinc metalloprotease FtsH, partial [Longimicrobiales bacterium]|nr:ATP-dependent zinc metalloprotease FtsH [Longimicrobiales bacterium]
EEGDTARYEEFSTFVPPFAGEELMSDLEARGVQVRAQPEGDGSWWPILWMVLPFALLLFLGWAALQRARQQGQGMLNIGKSKAKLYDKEESEGTTFDEVAGAEGAKRELQQVIEFLKEPERFHRLGADIPKGVLLVGPPGTGKTLMARAVAGEAEVPFFSITGSDFMEMFVGVGAKRVRDLFENAKEASPSIIFIDELDSIGRQRGAGLGGGHDEREQTLNQLLSELDGFEPTTDVIVIAATNRPDILDPALLRPGRFDRRVTVHLPTADQRLEILKIHAKDKPLDPEVDLEEIAQGTPGLSGADLENLLNEAALIAAQKDEEKITRDHLEQARDKVLMGLEREGMALTDEEKELLSYHESGHALVAVALPNTDPLHKVTIVPRGRAMGVTQQLPEEERYIYQKEYMLDRLAVMMGGRAAEDLVFDTATSGAEDDLRQATKLARKMVLSFGMSEKIGPISPGGAKEQVFLGEEIAQQREYSDETAREVDEEVRKIVSEAYDRARTVLSENRDALDRLASRLLEEEEVSGKAVLEILNGKPEEESGEEAGAGEEEGSVDADTEHDEDGGGSTAERVSRDAAS